MAKKSTVPFKMSKGILSKKRSVSKGNNPSPVRKPSNKKVC
jgi:hypothetical protein